MLNHDDNFILQDQFNVSSENDAGNIRDFFTEFDNSPFSIILDNSTPGNLVFKLPLHHLWEVNTEIHELLINSTSLEEARINFFTYLEKKERFLLGLKSKNLHPMQKVTIRDCLRIMKNIIGPINEQLSGTSSLEILWNLANEMTVNSVSNCFIMEFIHIFSGLNADTGIYPTDKNGNISDPPYTGLKGRHAAELRTEALDSVGNIINGMMSRYPSGLDEDVIRTRIENRQRILDYFNATDEDWNNYKWQLANVIRDEKPLIDLIQLSSKEIEAVKRISENSIPFGITPYYLSLMDYESSSEYDKAVRAQVIPSPVYVENLINHRMERAEFFDYMGEHDTSPVDLVTRRYPLIAIFKPFNTCAQICVYCQRNWEIDQVLDPDAMASRDSLRKALSWFDEHKNVVEVLITGGDPLVMRDETIRKILEILSEKEHIRRIRFGTRTPVVLPMRWTQSLVDILAEFHEPGKREIVVVTHFEHSYEITPETMKAVQRIKKKGISVYNQQVFTLYNSRQFESCKLRCDLRLIGIDPYYTFNMKGKKETRRFRVPVARLLQERKEEARLLPGIERTDEPVFNLPRMGKNHLRASQDRELIMIKPDGSRVYEFQPWEKNISPAPTYIYQDVPILEYLESLSEQGENLADYSSIWYYY
jgi:lysine 2,3-aminomutase